MIKTILVPVSGTPTDADVFATARALAEPLAAHLAFLHIRLSVTEAALHTPHMEFCIGPALPNAFDLLGRQMQDFSARAQAHVQDFCREAGIPLDTGPDGGRVTASWTEDIGDASGHLIERARHADLTVVGRQHHPDHMPQSLIERLLMGSGRPVVIASDGEPPAVIDTVMVGWKEKPAAARALTAAMPLLKQARRVILAQVRERAPAAGQLASLAAHLARHGIGAETREIIQPAIPTGVLLTATAEEMGVDLLVIGGYSHGPLREAIFGGVTRTAIEGSEVPVFLLH